MARKEKFLQQIKKLSQVDSGDEGVIPYVFENFSLELVTRICELNANTQITRIVFV